MFKCFRNRCSDPAGIRSHQRSEVLIQVIDRINHSHRGKIHFASKGTDTSEWMMKREHLSPRYTTSLADILVVS
ncbi:DUF4113 domain-containing protein [Plesiomonas shigelloides]|uniref:DUF4113 domain-containing protein n=1 Tax=Plesiomonas shigelloides TaxID=703 RepID=UPI001E2829DD|nr:DUF4113 domain-containing protein [Plesiomonas shigelloides]